MSTKLTLRLDESLINAAKKYAAQEGRSVSELVAAYFKRLDSPDGDATAKTDRVSMAGKAVFMACSRVENARSKTATKNLTWSTCRVSTSKTR